MLTLREFFFFYAFFLFAAISDKQLRNNNDFVWAIDTLLTGRFIIDLEFLDLKILTPSVSRFCYVLIRYFYKSIID